jgi:hypothetical protein
MAYYTDAYFAYGSLTSEEPKPRLLDAPDGARIKFRFHQRDIAKAFIRHANGSFSVWSLKWADSKERTMTLLYPIAVTTRQMP